MPHGCSLRFGGAAGCLRARSVYTGQFLTPLWTGPDPTGTAFTSSTTPATVTIRPDILRDPNLPSSERTLDRFNHPNYANPALNISSAATVGVISNVGVDSDLDPAGARSFRVGARLEW